MSKSPEQEVLERVRRIETRITSLAIEMGVPMPHHKAVFNNGTSQLLIPTPNISLKELLAAIPKGWHLPVDVLVSGEHVTTVDCRHRN